MTPFRAQLAAALAWLEARDNASLAVRELIATFKEALR